MLLTVYMEPVFGSWKQEHCADLLDDSLRNFITFAFTRKENKDFHRPIQAERLMRGKLNGSSQVPVFRILTGLGLSHPCFQGYSAAS